MLLTGGDMATVVMNRAEVVIVTMCDHAGLSFDWAARYLRGYGGMGYGTEPRFGSGYGCPEVGGPNTHFYAEWRHEPMYDLSSGRRGAGE